jgi:hypothetical protein
MSLPGPASYDEQMGTDPLCFSCASTSLRGAASYDEQMGTNPLCYLDGADWYCVMRLVGARLPSAAMPAFVNIP